jgi:hypothetical protein
MDSDRQLRAQVVSALEAVTPPAPWLASTIRESLRPHRRRRGKTMRILAPFPAHRLSAAVAVALIVLLVGTAAGIFALRNSFGHPVPAHRAESDAVRYAALLTRDKQHLDEASGRAVQVGADGTGCDGGPGDSACPTRLGVVEGAYQAWLGDLDHTTPPARFSAEQARMRADLEALIVVFRTAVADYNNVSGTGTPPGIFDPGNLGVTSTQVHPRDELLTIEEYVVYESSLGEPVRDAPTAAYVAMVGHDYDNVNLMALFICRHEALVCAGPVAATRSGIRAFLADLQATTPPPRFASMHEALVTSLGAELRSLDEVDVAIASGDYTPTGHIRESLFAEFNARREISTTADAILYAPG